MKKLTTAELDKKFDDGEDISQFLDWSNPQFPNRGIKRVNVDFPVGVLNALDKRAETLGVTRQSLIKLWIAEKLGL
jgi:hypothetical protein